jgi:hypothetical protein
MVLLILVALEYNAHRSTAVADLSGNGIFVPKERAFLNAARCSEGLTRYGPMQPPTEHRVPSDKRPPGGFR